MLYESKDMEDELEEAGLQSKSSRTEHLKPWQFQPGQSGNPSGKAKGTISLKVFAKNYIQDLSDDEKLEFLKGLDKDIIWEMAEGKAQSNTDITSGGKPIPLFDNTTNVLPNNNSNEESKISQ